MINSTPLKNQRFFKDKKGHIVLWQWPNLPLYGWIVCKILSLLLRGDLKAGLEQLGMAFLFTWAFLEITQGVNYFRKLLGLVVILALVIGYIT